MPFNTNYIPYKLKKQIGGLYNSPKGFSKKTMDDEIEKFYREKEKKRILDKIKEKRIREEFRQMNRKKRLEYRKKRCLREFSNPNTICDLFTDLNISENS